jgi:PAS domain S-box-containing protein
MISVLYVDDEEGLLELGKLFLEKSGQFRVDTVTSADEALRILKSTSYDAIVSDYQMPDMDGIALLKAIRTEFSDLPFIIFTGKGREEVVIEAFENGADFYLQKGGQPRPQFLELGHKITAAVRRRKAEKALLESENRYRNVVEDQTEFISRFLPDGTHIFVNEAYFRYFNKKRKDILGKKFKPDIPREDRRIVTEHFNSLTKEHPIGILEHRILLPDGRTRWQQWSDRAIFSDNGTLIEYQSVGRDITERKRAEEELHIKNDELHAAYEQIAATEEVLRNNYNELDKKEQKLRESEESYRSLAEASHDLIFMIDADDRVIYVNSYAASVLGKPASAIIGKTRSSHFPPEMAHRQEDPLHRVFQSGTPSRSDGAMMAGEEPRWFDHFLMPVKDKEGNVQAVVGVSRDITDRKNMEEILKQSENRFSNIINNLPDATLVIDPNGKVIAWNKAIEEMTGVSAQDMTGKGNFEYAIPFYGTRRPLLIDLIFKTDIEIANHYSGVIREKQNVLIAETSLQHLKGKRSTLWTKASPLYDDQENVVGAIESFRDITDVKKEQDPFTDS